MTYSMTCEYVTFGYSGASIGLRVREAEIGDRFYLSAWWRFGHSRRHRPQRRQL